MSSAQSGAVRFLLFGTGSIKYPIVGIGSRNYNLFGSAGVGVGLEVTGSNESALSVLPKLSILRENTGYHQVSSAKYVLESINLVLNPELLIPTRNERLGLTAGIGVDWMADLVVAEYHDQSSSKTSGQEAVWDTIEAARRPLIPFVSLGIRYQLHRGLHVQAFLRQDMYNAFPDNTVVTFGKDNEPLTVNLSHQPTRLGLNLMYVF